MIDDYLAWAPFFEIFPMEDDDHAEVSQLHGERFARVWSEAEIASLAAQDGVFGFVARQTNTFFSRPLAGFVLAREAAGEAEILTIAVGTKSLRLGLGWRLMQAALLEAGRRGAECMFLEVDGGNNPALSLYRRLRFEKVGERAGYYAAGDGRKSTALVMRRELR